MTSTTDVMSGGRERVKLWRWQVPPQGGLYLAVALAVVGFALIGLTWWKVSAYTNTAQQLPYFVSGGLTGLGLVVLGAAMLVVVTRHSDDKERQDQARALVEALQALADRESR